MLLTDPLFDALGAWQRGWHEKADLKIPPTENLLRETAKLPEEFRRVALPCYRKRFLFKPDMEALFMLEGLDDGVASWSTDRQFVLDFKGLVKPEAVTAVYFEHRPVQREIIVSFPSLWASADFRAAAEDYKKREGTEHRALFHFRDKQSEIVLKARLRSTEVKGIVGKSSSFDELCNQIGIYDEEERNRIFRELNENGVHFEKPHWRSEESAQRIIEAVCRTFLEKNAAVIESAARARRGRDIG